MTQEPYPVGPPVFWVLDNGSAHRGQRRARLQATWPTLVLVHTPSTPAGSTQIEIYFSSVQRKS